VFEECGSGLSLSSFWMPGEREGEKKRAKGEKKQHGTFEDLCFCRIGAAGRRPLERGEKEKKKRGEEREEEGGQSW